MVVVYRRQNLLPGRLWWMEKTPFVNRLWFAARNPAYPKRIGRSVD